MTATTLKVYERKWKNKKALRVYERKRRNNQALRVYERKRINNKAQGPTEEGVADSPVEKTLRQRFANYMLSASSDGEAKQSSYGKKTARTFKVYQRKNKGYTKGGGSVMESVGVRIPDTPVKKTQRQSFGNGKMTTPTLKVYQRKNKRAQDYAEGSIMESVRVQIPDNQVMKTQRQHSGNGKMTAPPFNIEGSFMPVHSQPEIMSSQYNLKNEELVDGKYCTGALKRKLHDATLQRPQSRLKRPQKTVYRPKVVRNLGRPVPRMEPKTPTKKRKMLKLKTPIKKKNVSSRESSSIVDLNHAQITVDLEPSVSERKSSSIDIEKHSEDGTGIISDTAVECCISDMRLYFLKKKKMGKKWELKDHCRIMEPNLGKRRKKKRMGRRCWGVEKSQKIVTDFVANFLPQGYSKKRRAAPKISQKKWRNFLGNENQPFPCFISQSEDLSIYESLTGIVSLLESDSFELFIKTIDAFGSNHGILAGYQVNENHGYQLDMVTTTKKEGSRQQKLEKLEHGELAHPWKLQLQNGVKEGDKYDQEQSEFWRKERALFKGRIDLFLTRTRSVQGDRKFSQWAGSVVDSIIGVFLTQNVADHLSSSAFLSLAAAFPCQPSCNREFTHANPRPSCEKSNIVNIEEYVEDEISKLSSEPSNDPTASSTSVESNLVFDKESCTATMESENQQISNSEMVLSSRCEIGGHGRSNQENYYVNMPSDGFECTRDIIENNSQSVFNAIKQKGKKLKADDRINIEGALVIGRMYWDYYKRKIENERGKRRDIEHIDSVDWQAVRKADVDDIAELIKGRGQQRNIADRLKKFLNEVNQDHGEINLEWLRWAPAELVRTYMTNIKGIGLKSLECVRLLALKQIAFPVDVNVGRIAIRLGWVPMQPLPDVQIHVLEKMPIMDDIQKYLWPRLKKLSFEELYELHYQMITFGKVFCTKRKPNCVACPMKNECKHYLSAYASAKHAALPKATEKQRQKKRDENHEIVCSNHLSSRYESLKEMRGCEPIIEEPASPGRPSPEPEYVERDIEDLFIGNQPEKFVPRNPYINAFRGSDISSLVPLFMTPEEAYYNSPHRLKEVERLRTIHWVYEIEDDSPILKKFKLERRHPKEVTRYLFAMCTSVSQPPEDKNNYKGSCSSLSIQDDLNIVQGTILIPCRTATRGSFPLNGTYFQINEVFADHASSISPIKVHRDWLWQQTKRLVYFGTSASHILKGISKDEVQGCFDRGFICVRAFNRRTRKPELLHERFHISTVKTTKKEQKDDE